MITRKDYMSKRATFVEYYRSVNETAGTHYIGDLDRVKVALAAGDEHLNTIPLSTWDHLATWAEPRLRGAFKKHGDFYSLAGGVCCMKQAALDAAKHGE